MSTRHVRVNGVVVEMFDDTDPKRKMNPMRVTLRFVQDSPYVDTDPDDIARLSVAGVKSLPLYQSEAVEAGIEWEEWVTVRNNQAIGT